MLKRANQKGGALVTYLTFGLISTGVAGYYMAQGKIIDRDSQQIKLLGQQLEQAQSAQLSCYNELRRWCTPGELSNYFPGDLSTVNGNINFNQTGDDLEFTVNMSSDREASALSDIVVNGVNTSTVVTSTIKPPTDASIFSDRLQRYSNSIDGNRTVMDSGFDLNENELNNIANLDVNNLIGTNVITTEMAVDTLIVQQELNLEGNRIIASGNDVDLETDNAIINTNLKVKGEVVLNSSDIYGLRNLTSVSAELDDLDGNVLTADNLTADQVDNENFTTESSSIENANITNLSIREITFDKASGDKITVDEVEVANSLIGHNFTSDSGEIVTLYSQDFTTDTAKIDTLNSDEIETQSAHVQTLNSPKATINTLSGDVFNTNTLNVSTYRADESIINAVAVNNSVNVDNRTQVNAAMDALQFYAQTTNVQNADIVDADINTVSATDVYIDANTSNLNKLEVRDLTLNEASADAAAIVNVWVNNNLNANKIVSQLATTRLLDVDEANLTLANFNNAEIRNFNTDNLYVSNLLANNEVDFDSLTSDGLSADHADIDTFKLNTLTVKKISSEFQSQSYSGNDYYASGDFFSQISSVNSNAGKLSALYKKLDECINDTGYCLEKEPDFIIQCLGCTQSDEKHDFTSTIQIEIKECLQGCTLFFDLDGLNAVSGCSSSTFPAGYTGTSTCKVSASVPSGTTLNFHPIVTVQNSRRTKFESSLSAAIQYTNNLSREPIFSFECDDCTLANDSGLYQSTVDIHVLQCADGCELKFKFPGLNEVSGCSDRIFGKGETGKVSCTVSKSLAKGDKFNTTFTATLENLVHEDTADLSTSISYENTGAISNPPQFSLNCKNCTQAEPGGMYKVDIEASITNCLDGCSITWDAPDFTSSTNCEDKNLTPGYQGKITCSLTKFVGEGITFKSQVDATVKNTMTNEVVTKSKTVSLYNNGVAIDPVKIASSIESYFWDVKINRSGKFGGVSEQNYSETTTRPSNEADTYIGENVFATITIYFRHINFTQNGVCADSGACSISIIDVKEDPRHNPCTSHNETGEGYGYFAKLNALRQGQKESCKVDVTYRIVHNESNIPYEQVVSIMPSALL